MHYLQLIPVVMPKQSSGIHTAAAAGELAWLLPIRAGLEILSVIMLGSTTTIRTTSVTAIAAALVVVVIGELLELRIQSANLISGLYSAILTKIALALNNIYFKV